MDLTSAQLSVLGLLIEKPQSQQGLEMTIDERNIGQWADDLAAVDEILAELTTRGLVEAETSSSGVVFYQPTDRGRAAASHSAYRFIAEGRPLPHPLIIGVANQRLVAPPDYARALSERFTLIDAQIRELGQSEREQSPLTPSAREAFSYTRAMLEAERSWLATRAQFT